MRLLLLVPTVLAACSGDHDLGEPGSTPIAPFAGEAAYVINGEDASISVIDTSTDEVIGTIQLANVEFPHHVYVSPDGATMLVAIVGADLSGGHTGGHGEHGGGGAVLALDTSTGALLAARRLDRPNHNAAFAPDGAIWTTQIDSPGEVLVLEAGSLATRSTMQVADEPSEVTFLAARAFVANTASDSVTVFDATSGAAVQTITVGDAPVGAWPASDGRLYVDNEAGKSLTVIDGASLAVVQTIDLGFTPALATIAPNGELWVTDTDSGALVFLDPTDGARLGEVATGAGAHAITFSGDGAKAYVTNQTANTVSVVSVAARGVVKTVPVGGKPNGIALRAR